MSQEWSDWINIEIYPSYNSYGVYKIRLVGSEGFPFEISRFLDNDNNGILMIGLSEDIENRIKKFHAAMKRGTCKHSEGKRFNLIRKYTNFNERYEGCNIQYSFKRLENENEAEREEERLLKCYFKRYGETPPLNKILPKKHINWENLSCD